MDSNVPPLMPDTIPARGDVVPAKISENHLSDLTSMGRNTTRNIEVLFSCKTFFVKDVILALFRDSFLTIGCGYPPNRAVEKLQRNLKVCKDSSKEEQSGSLTK